MCDACHSETDDDYEGDSIAEKRTKATRSIVSRHPDLAIEPAEITHRFAPKAAESCVRVNLGGTSPRYEIHIPSYTGQIASHSPSLSTIATAAWIASTKEYEAICTILGISAHTTHNAFFVSEHPPVHAQREADSNSTRAFEQAISDHLEETK